MRIIKDGDLTETVKPIVFECVNCGCLFEANHTEFEKSTIAEVMYDGFGDYKCKCPCCDRTVYTKRR